jgi:hypothetical protein
LKIIHIIIYKNNKMTDFREEAYILEKMEITEDDNDEDF